MAMRYLLERGYVVVEQKFRLGRRGEVEIIAGEGEYLVFWE